MPPPHRKILIVELWGIGDLTFSTVLIRKALEAGDEVHLLGKPHAKELLELSFPSVRFISFEAGWTKFIHKYRIWNWNLRNFFFLLLRLRREKYDMAVSARNDPRDHFLMTLIGARRRFGFSQWGEGTLLTTAVKRSKGSLQHKVQDWRDLGTAMGYRNLLDADPKLTYPSYHSGYIDQILEGNDLPLLVLHVGARIAVRRWPVHYFEELVRRLRKAFYFYLILIPDPDGYGMELAPLANLVFEHLDLPELTNVIGRADLVLCNDSGPGHLAAICERPAISLFGPTEPSWFRPWGAWHRVLRRDFCSRLPCFDYCHFPEPYCMTRLTPALVWPEVEAHIRYLAANRKIPANFVPDDKPGVPFVGIVVATYKRPVEFARLLRSLESISVPLAVVVADNADDPATSAVVEAAKGRLEVVRLVPGRNLGCGGGLALAEKEALRRYGDKLTHFWIMDDDAVVTRGTLEILLAAMDEEKAIAACPMVLDEKGEIGWFPGLLERSVFNAVRKRQVRTPEEYRKRFGEKAIPFSWATGVSLLVERGALESVGFHREDFLVRGEDLDFSLRVTAWARGIYVPEVQVQHLPPSPALVAETRALERRKGAIMLQNVAYIALHRAYGRRILRTMPGNFWHFVRAWGIGSVMEALVAYLKGGVYGVPAGHDVASEKKLLVFAHTPPPYHGQSFMVSLMLEGFGEGAGETGKSSASQIQCYHINCRFSKNMEDIGSMRLSKLFLLLWYCIEAIWLRFRYGVREFYYVPAPGKESPLYRDWIVMVLCRPFFKRIILHWHASGLTDWLENSRSRLERRITKLLLGRPQLSIALAEASSRDACWLNSQHIAIVPNGIPDPCPDFETDLLCRRKARWSELMHQWEESRQKGTPPAEFRLLYISHCTREKGLFDTLEGVALFNQRLNGLRIQLTVAGNFMEDKEEEEFRNRIALPDLNGSVDYVGFVGGQEKKRLFEISDGLSFASYYAAESFGLVVVEAMAYGLPLVATRWNAIPEILPPDYVGMVDPRSPKQIADALEVIAKTDLSATLRNRFKARFGLHSYLQLLTEAINSYSS